MSKMSVQRRLAGASSPRQASAPISLGGYLILYSQYILITLLVLAALVLRLAFGAP